MKSFHCGRCGQLVFFENVRCERCEAPLGYLPDLGEVSAFAPDDDGTWHSLHPAAEGKPYRPCHNYAVENVCNWMIPADAAHADDTLCAACQLTATIPNLDTPGNRLLWYKVEVAKRRLLYTLDMLGLPIGTGDLPADRPMRFAFMESTEDEPVLTGHADGLVTLNIAEADDAERERVRAQMHEPYRTLLGHFRHEIGHYYFDRLVRGTHWIEPFRARFGDERADYQAALAQHYEHGAPEGWEDQYISSYAATHPFEDWAETWAHYLHIVDTLDTATACGLVLAPEDERLPQLSDQTAVDEASFHNLMQRWFPLTYALNSLNRSLGAPDAYPFALAPAVVAKLRFVHNVVSAARRASRAAMAPGSEAAPGATAAGSSSEADGAARA